jgi:hypothetical protein
MSGDTADRDLRQALVDLVYVKRKLNEALKKPGSFGFNKAALPDDPTALRDLLVGDIARVHALLDELNDRFALP